MTKRTKSIVLGVVALGALPGATPLILLHTLSVSPVDMSAASTATGTVTLGAGARVDTEFTLASSDPRLATVPASVTVRRGSISETFPVQAATNAVGCPLIRATNGTTSASARVFISALQVTTLPVTLRLLTNPAYPRTYIKGRVTLRDPAPAGGAFVSITHTGSVAIPANGVRVPERQTVAEFDIYVGNENNQLTCSVITATYGTSSRQLLKLLPN